jgi:uncharacterized membrane protein YeaQ/YmgE (transglycosylase-associated protein family)
MFGLGNIVWYLVIGVIAGWLAGQISRGGGFGLWGDMIVGIIGAMVGGFVFGLLGITTYSTIGAIITSTIGAILFLWVIRLFTGDRTTAPK